MNHHTARSVLTATRKRKDREDMYKGSFGNFHKLHHPHPHQHQHQHQPPLNGTNTTSSSSSGPRPGEPGSSNRLLAGYMAYEFLTRGTLFGQKFDPARAEAVPLAAADSKRKHNQNQNQNQTGSSEPEVGKSSRSYAEVAQLLKTDGAHIPGVFNPTQLARWIQM